ncbi:MAG: 50S ribosomal protein L4 [Chloroflexi bacterium RBG_13_54_8]|nr:MAG: 50S ribosomal protein L4 [Chloroflexi bacterium RBG_13_54_8]
MKFPLHNVSGEVVDHIEIQDSIFAVPFNEAVVHQAMVRQLANARLGTAATKTRGEVSGSTRKLFAQKHTGRARRGDRRSPLLRGGGVTFGPHPRSYRQKMPKKMRRLALRCVLSAKASSGEMVIVDRFGFAEPGTAQMMGILKALGADHSALIVTAVPEQDVVKSSGNLPKTRTLPAALVNVADLLSHKFLVINMDGLRRVEEIWGEGHSA